MPTTTDANRIAQQAHTHKPSASKVFGRVCLLGVDDEVLREWFVDKQNPVVGADTRADIQIAELQPRHLNIVFGRRNTLIKSVHGTFSVGAKQVREILIDEPTTLQVNELKLKVFPTAYVRKPLGYTSNTDLMDGVGKATDSPSSSALVDSNSGSDQVSANLNEEKLQQIIVASTVAAMQKSLEPLSHTLKSLNQKFESLPTQNQERAQQLSIDIEKRFEQIERQLPTLATEIEHLNQKFDATLEKNDASIQSLASGIREQIAGFVDHIQESSSTREQAIERTLGALSDQLNQLQSRIEDSQLQYGTEQQAENTPYQEHEAAPENTLGWYSNQATTDYDSSGHVAYEDQVSELYSPVYDHDGRFADQAEDFPANLQPQTESQGYPSSEESDRQAAPFSATDSEIAYSPANYFRDRTEQHPEPDSHYYSGGEDGLDADAAFNNRDVVDQTYGPSYYRTSNAAEAEDEDQASLADSDVDPYANNVQYEVAHDVSEQDLSDVDQAFDDPYLDQHISDSSQTGWVEVDYRQIGKLEVDESTSEPPNPFSETDTDAANQYEEQNDAENSAPLKLPTWFVKDDVNEISETENNSIRDDFNDLEDDYQPLRQQPSAVYTPFRSQPIERDSISSDEDKLYEVANNDDEARPTLRGEFDSSETGSHLQSWQKTDATSSIEEDEEENSNLSAVYSRSSQRIESDASDLGEIDEQRSDLDVVNNDHKVIPAKSVAEASDQEEDGEEETVEAYMQRLLARVKGEAEPSPPPPVPKPTAQKSAPKSVPVEPLKEEPTKPKTTTQINQELARKRKLELEESLGMETLTQDAYIPRSAVPEQTVDLDAMRKLANETARTAIARSNKKPASEKPNIKGKLTMAIVGFIVGTAILLMNGLTMNIAFVGMVCGYLIFLIWGYEASQAAPASTKRS